MKERRKLPSNWAEVTIDVLLQPFSDGRLLHHGWSPQCEAEPSPSDDEWGVLKTTAVQDGRFLAEHNKRLPLKLTPRSHLEVAAGDILITCAGPRNRCGVPCLVRSTRPKLILSGKMYRLRVRDAVMDAAFLEAFLRAKDTQDEIDRMKTGISDSGLNLTHDRFFRLTVPVAPLQEQKRIVASIEELFSDLDAGVAALKRAKANLRRYRAAVLKAAVEGKLTEDRRARHPAKEPASKLLARILQERRQKWEAEQLARFAAAKKEPPKNWREKYVEPAPPDVTRLPTFDPPSSWCWGTLDAIAYVTKLAGFEYTKYVKYDPEGDLPVIKAENAGKEGFRFTDFSFVRSGTVKNLERSHLHGGELLMVFVGVGVGQVAIVPSDRPYFLGPNIGMMRVESTFALPRYCELFLRSSVGYSLALSFAKAVAQPSLSMGTIRQIPILLPPLEEQKRIVEELDERLSLVDVAETQIEYGLLRAARLRQSILKQAFEGKLVPQDPADEPASVLLERLQANRSGNDRNGTATTQSRPRGRRRKSQTTGREV